MLVYIGIRILISSTSEQKAKYKQLLGDWVVGMVLLFTMQYIMSFSNIAVDRLTEVFTSINPMGQTALIPDNDDKVENELNAYEIKVVKKKTEITKDNNKMVYKYEEKGGDKYIEWNTDLMGRLRIDLQTYKEDKETYIGYTIMYIVLVIYTGIFIYTYIKRVIYMAFLTMISPLVALTYPIDKANDGSAQGFNYWFKEYIFNLLLQPLHLLIYTILVSTAIKLATSNMLYSLVAIGFIASAEKILRQMFNFSKASTPGIFAGPAGAALTMTGMRWLFGHGPRGVRDSLKGGSAKNGSSQEIGDENVGQSIDVADAFKDIVGPGIDEETGVRAESIVSEGTGTSTDTGIGAASSIGGNTGNARINTGVRRMNARQYIESRESAEAIQRRSIRDKLKEGKKIDLENKKRRRLALGDTARAFSTGMKRKFVRSLENAQPARALGRLATGAIGAATFGTLGVAAGVASGDAKYVGQYGAAAAAGGYKIGKDVYGAVDNALTVDGLDKVYQRARLGEEKYKEMIAHKKQMEKAHDEATIRRIQEKEKISRKEAEEKAEEYAQKYMAYKIDDVDAWIALNKMEGIKAQKADGTIDNYTTKEAVAAYKVHKRAGLDSKEKDKAIQKIQSDWNLNADQAKAYYRTAKVLDDIMNG